MCEAREQRGLMIAAKSRIRKSGDGWIVPSQAEASHAYKVYEDGDIFRCTCPDHEINGQTCKHIYAVKIVIEREENGDGSVTETVTMTQVVKRKTYAQNWPAYNAAQTNEKATFQTLLRDLCKGIKDPKPAGRGRPTIPLPDAIFAAVFKVYSTVSGRRFISDLRDAQAKGFIRRAPCYNSIFNVFDSETTSEVLQALVIETANPLKAIETNFACDSSGFSGSRFDRWFDHKWGEHKIKRAWVKCHVMCGVRTNVVTAVEIHDQHAADSPLLKPMLATTAARFNVNEVSADMGYLSESNYEAIVQAGAAPYIPFKSNCSATREGIWNTMFHFFHLHREDFLSRYHQRSNVETTFSMIKAKFGDGVRSKTDTAMKNEVLAKIVCHNVCCLISAIHELGVDPVFWVDPCDDNCRATL
jgi:transposase